MIDEKTEILSLVLSAVAALFRDELDTTKVLLKMASTRTSEFIEDSEGGKDE